MRQNTPPKYEGLQVLRVIAAVFVLALHATFYTQERLFSGQEKWAAGYSGVDIFFVLSGFVMIYSSERLFNSRDGWRIFAERRIARIVPMYWLATTIKVLLTLLAGRYVLHTDLTISKALASYFFIPCKNMDGLIEPLVGVGWTLNFEMFFYSLFALALFLRINVYRFVGVALTLISLGAIARKPDWPAISFYLNTIVLEFFLGMLIAHQCLKNRRLNKISAIIAITLGFIGLLSWPLYTVMLPRILTIGIPAALLVAGTASIEDLLPRMPRSVLFLAEASYVIYLFHPLVAPIAPTFFSKFHFIHPGLAIAFSILIGIIAGSVVYEFADRPSSIWLRDHLKIRHKKFIHVPKV